ncbi:hypothetical protein MUG91_G19n39 [Manis pentadactyla]|nr:hypothetical protein MUG91_G19n39 [Manis pentadactyla]
MPKGLGYCPVPVGASIPEARASCTSRSGALTTAQLGKNNELPGRRRRGARSILAPQSSSEAAASLQGWWGVGKRKLEGQQKCASAESVRTRRAPAGRRRECGTGYGSLREEPLLGGGGEDGLERRRRVPNGRGPRLRQRGRSSLVSQSALAPSPRALAPQGLAPGAVCSGLRGSSPPAGGRTGPAGCLGPLRPGPARTMQGEGCRKRGVLSARGALGFPASFPPPRLSVAALGGPSRLFWFLSAWG